MSESTDHQEGQILLRRVTEFWAPISLFIGGVISLYNLYQLWLGDQALITYISGGLGFGILIFLLSYISFSQRQKRLTIFPKTTYYEFRFPKYYKITRVVLVLCCVFFIISSISVYYHNKWLDKQFIILVSDFTGPNSDHYRINEIVLSKLRTGLLNETGVIIRPFSKAITEQDGSEKAREIGKRYQADLVLWGWYGVTDSDTLITLHFENLTNKDNLSVSEPENDTLIYKETAKKIDSFEIQQQLSGELTGLILVTMGIIEEQGNNYEESRKLFERAIDTWDENLIGNEYLYYQRGWAYFRLNDCKNAISDYSKFLSIRPDGRELDVVYQLRGVCYYIQEEYKLAINDYSAAIKRSPKSDPYYLMRAQCYYYVGEYILSLNDLDKWQEYAINRELDSKNNKPFDPKTENSLDEYRAEVLRGENFEALGKFEEAIQHYSVIDQGYRGIITIYPLLRRANLYFKLKKYEEALKDYSSILGMYDEYKVGYADFQTTLKFQAEEAYLHRAQIHSISGDNSLAIQDVDSALKINDQRKISYLLRAHYHFLNNEPQETIQDLNTLLELSDDMYVHQIINEIIGLIANKSSFSENEKKDILEKILGINNFITD